MYYFFLIDHKVQDYETMVSFQVNALDLAPNYAASLTSLVNTTSTLIAGIGVPYIIGYLTPNVSMMKLFSKFQRFGCAISTERRPLKV